MKIHADNLNKREIYCTSILVRTYAYYLPLLDGKVIQKYCFILSLSSSVHLKSKTKYANQEGGEDEVLR